MQLPPVRQGHKKLLLVQPPFYRLFHDDFSLVRYPLTLAYLAGAVKQHTDWDVAIYNADFNHGGKHPTEVSYLTGPGFDNYVDNLRNMSGSVWDEMRRVIAEYKPDAIGITATSQTFLSARRIGAIAKQANPNTCVVVGGPHASIAGARILEHPEIDVVARGEGEDTLVEIIKTLEQGRSLEGVKGTIIRKGDEILEQEGRPVIKDLDTLPIPFQVVPDTLVDYQDYPAHSFRYVFATRGCPFNCLFCGSREIWGRKSRVRSPENVVYEMQGLHNLGVKRIHFEDDLFGTTKKHIHALCDAMIRLCPDTQWSCELHANLVDDETISHMRAAGCFSILMGVESGDDGILEKMRKSLTVEQALEACRVIRSHGIELMTFFLVGFPDETEETLAKTVRMMRATKSDEIIYSIFTPYPFTEAWELCRERGLIKEDFDMSMFHHQSPANCFTEHIEPKRFRALATQIEHMVDRWNRRGKLRRKVRRLTKWMRPQPQLSGHHAWERTEQEVLTKAA